MADLALLERLSLLPGVSGREDAVREALIREIAPFAEWRVDAPGNLIVEKKGRRPAKKKLMLCAHMDEAGLMVTGLCEDGTLRFAATPGTEEAVLAGARVSVGSRGIPGVLAVPPIHLCEGDERNKPFPADRLRIDIGTETREEAEQLVRPGDTAVFVTRFDREGSAVRGKALDDRAGCALLTEMIRAEQEYDLTFVFAVQGKTEHGGARTAAFSVDPEAALVLDAAEAADLPGTPREEWITEPGKGPALCAMDRRTVFDRGLYALALETAERERLPVQLRSRVTGSSDAEVICCSRGGVRTLAISLPCRYPRTPVHFLNSDDYDAALALTTALAARIAGDEA